jgi:uncharacterized membrane protein YfhO
VDNFIYAANPDEEIALIEHTDLKKTAIVGEDFAAVKEVIARSGSDMAICRPTITLTHYAPNELRYSFSTDSERIAIFSEIYYPKGWKAWIEPEGKPVELFRADWMLRGAVIPQGEGQLIMRFEPDSYQLGANISRASSILLILLLIGSAAGMIFRTYPGKRVKK